MSSPSHRRSTASPTSISTKPLWRSACLRSFRSHELKRLGLTIGLEGASLRDAVELCLEAERLGYTDAWSAEVGGADGIAPLAALAGAGSKLRLGTAILPVFTRPPALLAMTGAAMQDLSGGRFVLGLGTSSDIIVSRWMGTGFERPLTRLRETVEAVRSALAGGKVDVQGTTVSTRGFRLQVPVPEPPSIYIAALGPKACRLAGEIADGVIFFLKTPEGVARALDDVAEGARSVGRDPSELDVVIRIAVALDEDNSAYRSFSRRLITSYAMVDVYNRSLAAQGFGAAMAAIREAWQAGRRDEAAAAVTDELIDALQVAGDAEACRSGIESYRAAGVKTPVVFPLSVVSDAEARRQRIRSAVAALAPQAADATRS